MPSGKNAGRGGDRSGRVWEGWEVVAVESQGVGELAPGDLHAVAGVAAEADHRAINHLALAFAGLRDAWFCDCSHNLLGPQLSQRSLRWFPAGKTPCHRAPLRGTLP